MMQESKLWNEINADSPYFENEELFQNHLMEQYSIYVEMADRISQRRNLTNVFFLTLSTSLVTGICFTLGGGSELPNLLTSLLALLGTVVSIAWWWLLRSYRNLNSAKYKVIGQLEEKLPSSPYWSAEWKELGEGKSLKKYLPLSKLEQFIPLIFLIGYIGIIVFS